MRTTGTILLILALAIAAYAVRTQPKSGGSDTPVPASKEVVVYAALDEEFSKPILEAFEKKTGIKVKMVFDAESTKTVGLTNRLLAEKDRPRCDIFWNNEPVNTIRLKKEGVLQEYRSPAAKDFPKAFLDPDGMWTGFAARARVLIVNTDQVKEEDMPVYLSDLLRAEWEGKIGIAKPLFGSTATWVTALYQQHKATGKPIPKARTEMPTASATPALQTPLQVLTKIVELDGVKVLGGNKQTALAVSDGTLPMAFTDTDDAIIEVESGKPVKLVFFRNGLRKDKNAGAMFFPNTLSMIKDCPHPENAKKLIDFLLSPEVEIMLGNSSSAQIPVNPAVKPGEDYKPRTMTPNDVPPMEVDWDAVAEEWDGSMDWIRKNVK